MSLPLCALALFALAALLLPSLTTPADAIPFSAAAPPTLIAVLSSSGQWCFLDATSRGITSIDSGDLSAYSSSTCQTKDGPRPISGILLGNNSLSWLPSDVFPFTNLILISLARNQFNGSLESIGNWFGTGLAGSCVFCKVLSGYLPVLDVSFNPLGGLTGSVPSSFQQIPTAPYTFVSLILMGCGFTSIQPNAFANVALNSLDLSLNDLSSGLHPGSFSSISSYSLALRNCRLRSSSLVPGVFDVPSVLQLQNLDLSVADRLSVDFPFVPHAPNLLFDPLQRVFSKQHFTPAGQSWSFHPPTPAQFDASWGNLFVEFPSDVLSRGSTWLSIQLGDVVSVNPAFLRGVAFTTCVSITVSLAPSSVAAPLMPAGQQYCPLHSLVRGFNWALANTTVELCTLNVLGYDLPTTSECGDFSTCVACRPWNRMDFAGLRSLTTEPALLEPAFTQYMSQTAGGTINSFGFVPPILDMWSPRLNRSDWISIAALCGIRTGTITLPALPFSLTADPSSPSFPFSLPAGLLECVANTATVTDVDCSSVMLFSSDMLTGLTPTAQQSWYWTFNVEALLGTALPIPPGLFDPLPASSTEKPIDCTVPSTVCTRLQSHCPYIVEGVCQPWSTQPQHA